MLAGQSPTPHHSPDGVMLTFERFAAIFGSRLVAAFDSIPASRYDYRPTPPQQTIGFIAQHLEDANYGLCERFSEVKHHRAAEDSVADTVKARWPKDTLVARLESSLRFCDTAIERAGRLESPTLAANLLAFETDLAEHYAQISSYMRLLGMVPPSALPPPPRKAIELPASELKAYVGIYQLGPDAELDVSVQNGGLFIRSTVSGSAVRLWPESKDKFFVKEADAQVTFTRNAKGAVTGLVLHQFGRDRRATRGP
jgi:uncharacterized damage-inducible protein DinB